MLKIEDIEPSRIIVWELFSELFLDRDITASDYQRIADCLKNTSYTSRELEKILFNEVYPVCIDNLNQVAGEWSGFDKTWLTTEILKALNKSRLLTSLKPGKKMIRDHWENIKEKITP